MISRLLAVLLLVPAIAGAEDIVVFPPSGPVVDSAADPVVVGPVAGPVVSPYGAYGCPRHWIYDYLPAYDALGDRYGVVNGYGYGYQNRRYDYRSGLKAIPGRSTLDPAVPYSDYLANQRRLQAAAPPPPPAPTAASLTPSADRAILEFSLPSEQAKLWLDNQSVDGDGKTRSLQTPPLIPGRTYKFAVKVTWPSSNPFEDHSKEEIVTFRAGDRKRIEIRDKN
jgi:uncharacterized protein (TIGR03000 family)